MTLHERVGPAHTTISDVADLAGVGRMTVYKHFPTDTELFRACGNLWLERNPPPDFSDCFEEPEAGKRARRLLARLYGYYRRTHAMMGKILRDAPLLPALETVVDEGWMVYLRDLEDRLVRGIGSARSKRLRAAARLALDLHTWEVLAGSGLSDAEAAVLTADWLTGAAISGSPGG